MRIFWDWDKTLGLQPFWNKFAAENTEFARRLDTMFASDDVRPWMRGKLGFDDMHQKFLHGYDKEYLRKRLVGDWAVGEVFNERLWQEFARQYPDAVHHVVTDNMDVFNDFVAANQPFFDRFDRVYNSADYGVLKSDPDGLLYRIMGEIGCGTFHGDLLLDDSPENCQTFKSLGGAAICVEKAR